MLLYSRPLWCVLSAYVAARCGVLASRCGCVSFTIPQDVLERAGKVLEDVANDKQSYGCYSSPLRVCFLPAVASVLGRKPANDKGSWGKWNGNQSYKRESSGSTLPWKRAKHRG